MHDWMAGSYQPLLTRKLDEETCRKFGYKTGTDRDGSPVQIAEYRNADGELVAQKIRGADKQFRVIGGGKDMPLFGQHLWSGKGTRVIVTEGELDALSVAQVFGLRWEVVSVPNGASGAKRSVQRAVEWLEGFEQVVFMFDADEPGREAALECAQVLTPGKARIAELPRKDASEMLQAGMTKELVSAVYNARVFRPDGIVSLLDIRNRALSDVVPGYPWKDVRLNEWTYGRRPGEVIGFGGGTGCGKSDFLAEQVAYDVVDLGLTVGVLFLEQSVGETGRRLAGKVAGRRFHIPGGGWTQAELEGAWGALEVTGRLHLFDSWGVADWETISARITYMIVSLGCQVIYLDHLTALAAAEDDERKALEKIMAAAAGLAQRHGIVLHYVSHLSTPEGKPHEEGGRVMGKHFKGSRAIQYWSHFMFGIERDTQAEDPDVRKRSTLRCLKDRNTGRALGRVWGYSYDGVKGLLVPCEMALKGGEAFGDETRDF